MPRVIAGTSAGGLIAALVCTRSDEELRLLLNPKLADNMYVCSSSNGVGLIIVIARHVKNLLAFGGIDFLHVEIY